MRRLPRRRRRSLGQAGDAIANWTCLASSGLARLSGLAVLRLPLTGLTVTSELATLGWLAALRLLAARFAGLTLSAWGLPGLTIGTSAEAAELVAQTR